MGIVEVGFWLRCETSRRQTFFRSLCVPSFVLLLSMLPASVQAQFIYTTNNGTIIITGYNGPGGDVTIPDTIDGVRVTSIANFAFWNSFNLVTLTIPDSVTNIGDHTFDSCINLDSITVDGLNPVYSSVVGVLFNKDQTLLVQFPTGRAGSYTIPNSVTRIGNAAFLYANNLTNIVIGSWVSDLGSFSFYFCTGLTAITVDPGNPFFSSDVGVLFDKSQTTLIRCPAARTGGYEIPDSVTSIGGGAFIYCWTLTNVTIGSNVTNIPNDAFDSCMSLMTITVDALSPTYSSDVGVLFDKNQTTLIRYPRAGLGSYTVPNTVSKIGNGSFRDCNNLTKVIIADSVGIVGNDAFAGLWTGNTRR